MTKIFSPKKLIEVSLPLDDINAAAAREKSIRHGHPSTLHLWWARRPLAAARAVIFAQMVNDPGYQDGDGFKYGVNKKEAGIKREKLFQIIRDLVRWDNTNNEEVLELAREAIKESWLETCHLNRKHPQADELFNPEKIPAFHDPFAGGGAIPLEAQRLGLETYASDLNPVAVMINKAMIEISPKFLNQPPVGPITNDAKQPDLMDDWSGSRGLAEDVSRYGSWMRKEAFRRVGHLYPKFMITSSMSNARKELKQYEGEELTVIAWLWARTVKSPNPAFSHVDVPLASTFVLSKKPSNRAYLEPVINGDSLSFIVRDGEAPDDLKNGTKLSRGANFRCILSGTPMDPKYIKSEGMAGRIGSCLLAIVLEGKKGRVYVDPSFENSDHVASRSVAADWRPDTNIPHDKKSMFTPLYGLSKFGDLFTSRQLKTIDALATLVKDVADKASDDARTAGLTDDDVTLANGGSGTKAYGESIAVCMAFFISRMVNLLHPNPNLLKSIR